MVSLKVRVHAGGMEFPGEKSSHGCASLFAREGQVEASEGPQVLQLT